MREWTLGDTEARIRILKEERTMEERRRYDQEQRLEKAKSRGRNLTKEIGEMREREERNGIKRR